MRPHPIAHPIPPVSEPLQYRAIGVVRGSYVPADPAQLTRGVIRTAEGNALPWPTVDDTSNTGAILAENTSISTSVDPTFGTITFGAYKYSSKPVLVPNELLQDSSFDLASYIASALGQRLGRIQNTHFTTGDNSSKPNGLVTASGLGNTAATATAITMDELIVTQHALDIAYRQGAAWMMNDAVASYLRRLKGGDGQYLWQPSVVAGRPDMLLGSPTWINNDMASGISGTNKTLVYGDFSKYMIRDAGSVRLVRMNERYADTDQVGFVAFLRSDADLLDAGTNPVVHFKQG
jgi:HK97 family phage major capsid protein